MKISLSIVRKYLPLAAGLVILLVILLLAPWEEIDNLLADIHPSVYVLLFLLSIVYFVSKAIRFWYILQKLDIKLRLGQIIPLYIAGQPFAFLPAGELYRTVLLERYHDVKVRQSAPSITIQGLVEAIVLLSFSLVGAFVIGQNRVIVIIIALLLAVLLISLRRGWLTEQHTLVNKIPFVSIRKDKYEEFIEGHRRLFAPRSLAIMVALSFIPVLAGIGILYLSADSVNTHLSIVEASISYTLPVILSGLTFLPGGIGVGEGGTIGLLYIFGVSAAAAITVTLLLRIFTLAIGIFYGLFAQLILYWRYSK